MMQKIEDKIGTLNDSLRNACIKIIEFQDTKDTRTLMDVIHWVRVADINGRIIKDYYNIKDIK
jgi:hypothetical protein